MVRPDLADHLVNPTVSGKQLSGGHDLTNFNTALSDANGVVVSKIEKGPGIYEIQYQLPNATKPATKTVYDAAMYPNMTDMANTAANKALIQYQITGKIDPTIVVSGITFDVRIAVPLGGCSVRQDCVSSESRQMKWGHSYEADIAHQLLFWVLQCVFRPYNAPLDCWLKHILVNGGGLGGDPGWEMEHLLSDSGPGDYRVWGDPDMSGIEPAEAIYSAEVVYRAIRESLIAFAEAYPEKLNEVHEVLDRYKL